MANTSSSSFTLQSLSENSLTINTKDRIDSSLIVLVVLSTKDRIDLLFDASFSFSTEDRIDLSFEFDLIALRLLQHKIVLIFPSP